MSVTANNVLDEAAALLNDPTQKMFSDEILLPLLKRAYSDLQLHLHEEQVQVLNEVSVILSVPQGTNSVAAPADCIQPVRMEEQNPNAATWTPMYEKQWEPNLTPAQTLLYWVWRENTFHFVGATTARYVRPYYLKSLPVITTVNSTIDVNFSQPYLAARTAYYAAAYIGENPTKAGMLKTDAEDALGMLLTMEANRRQSLPVRRIPASRSINRGIIR